MQDPELLKHYPLVEPDFGGSIQRNFFTSISYLQKNGAEKVEPYDVENYLEEAYPAKYLAFQKRNMKSVLESFVEMAQPESFEYHYGVIKKYAVLRCANEKGFDISEFICDGNEVDPDVAEKKRKFFEEFNASGLVQYFESKVGELRAEMGIATTPSLKFNRISELPLSQMEEKYLIQDFMLENTFNSIIAAAKVGKSQLAYQMAFCV